MNNAEIIAEVNRTGDTLIAANNAYSENDEKTRAARFDIDTFRPEDRARHVEALKTASRATETLRQAATLAEIAHAYAVERLRQALERAAYQAAADVLPAYVGKAAGEKTRAKFCAEIVTRAAAAVGLDVQACRLSAYFDGRSWLRVVAYVGDLSYKSATVYARSASFFDACNKFAPVELDPPAPHVDDRTPERFAADFVDAEKQIDSLLDQAKAEADRLRASVTCGYVRPGYASVAVTRRQLSA